MKFLGLIPARGGSKSIHQKNLALCAGKPLIDYTFAAAKASRLLDRLILSTNDSDIADYSKAADIEVPFMRPEQLATDTASTAAVAAHAILALEQQNEQYDAVVILQPTSPLRRTADIDGAIELFISSHADSLASITEAPHAFCPESVLRLDGSAIHPYLTLENPPLRRQDKPTYFGRNGPAIIITATTLIKEEKLYGSQVHGYLMPKLTSIDIDDADDLRLAELLLRDNLGEQHE